MVRQRLRLLTLLTLMWGGAVSMAEAEIVFFTTGRTMSVQGHRVDGDSIVLFLRAGGEIVCSVNLIARIEPDEIQEPDSAVQVPSAAPDEAPRAPTDVPFAELILNLSEKHGVNPELVRAVIKVESNFQPAARSPKGAMGLMQLMPETASRYAVEDPYDPRANIEAGVRHLKWLLEEFDLSLALAAYNAGEGAVRRFGGVPPYRETQEYVSRVLGLWTPGE